MLRPLTGAAAALLAVWAAGLAGRCAAFSPAPPGSRLQRGAARLRESGGDGADAAAAAEDAADDAAEDAPAVPAGRTSEDYWKVTSEDVVEMMDSLRANMKTVKAGERAGPKRYEEMEPKELEAIMAAGRAEMNKTFTGMIDAVQKRSLEQSKVDNPYLTQEQNDNLRALQALRQQAADVAGEAVDAPSATLGRDAASIISAKLATGSGKGVDPIAAVDSIIETVEEMKRAMAAAADAMADARTAQISKEAAVERERLETLTKVLQAAEDKDVFPPRPEDDAIRRQVEADFEAKARARAGPGDDAPLPLKFRMATVAAGGGALDAAVRAELAALGLDVVDEATGRADVLVLLPAAAATPDAVAEMIQARNATHVVLCSVHGTRRKQAFGASLFGAFGSGADKARALEDAAKFQTGKMCASLAVVRLGELSDAKAKGMAVLDVDDVLDGAVALGVAGGCVARAAASARNTSLSVAGADAPPDWDDLILKVDGPELLRLYPDATTDVGELRAWLGEWAKLWLGGTTGARLTTRVDVKAAKFGAAMRFLDPKRKAGNGGLDLRAEFDPTTAAPRVRVVRAGYGDDVAVKQMSEQAIVDRLVNDVAKTWGSKL
ncbi:hypothetical protein M885DRAFT_541779 [Pelagophyceae sp. CCMP2097]|nr:hypothetical protein M885DRAFT_541779 [Pelagophyceae sp. CCMP2097]